MCSVLHPTRHVMGTLENLAGAVYDHASYNVVY